MMCCAVSALAQLGTPPNDEIWYTTTDGNKCDPYKSDVFGATYISNKYENGHGTIKFDGNVTSIGEDAFFDCSSLTSITIPGSVTSIRNYAFTECSSLTSITIPSGVTSIGYSAFEDCSSLTSITIPSGVTSIGDYAFGYCSSLTSITIPSGVTSIGVRAFAWDKLLSVVLLLGNGNIELGDRAFYETPATIYVADVANFSETWGDRPVRAWRSGEGDGTKNNPYQIATLENLLWFANYVNAGNTSACAELTADITLNTGVLDSNGNLNSGTFMEWTPMGTYEKGYSGEFNGNGHTINGLYVNEKDNDRAGLFGMAVSGAYIHDLGVKDSYFCGNIWVAGICGDFASGTIENCWNGATVIGCHSSPCTGGIAGSCWKNASVNGCYNIGNVSVESSDKSQCGGICGIVAKNTSATYSVSNCISLKGKCEEAYNVYTENYNYSELLPNESYSSIGNASVSNVYNDKDASAFKSGEVCWILNGNQRSITWRQQLGTDDFPAWTGDNIVYNDATGYHNETVCEVAENHIHNWMTPKTITQSDGSKISFYHCEECRKYYQSDDRTIELSAELCTRVQPSVGDGTKDNPYQIATMENLMWFADYVNGDSQHASACAILTADITMNDGVLDSYGRSNDGLFDAWTPIGGHNVDYKGEFNGNGHTISGLYFKDTSKNNVGLFGKLVGNAYIHDLGIRDSYFYGLDHVGGICGDFASGRIENCWSGAYVMAHKYDAGGISGSCYVNASIANCYNIGDVSTYEEKGGTQDTRFGGICGSVYSSSATYSIDNCYTLKSRAIPEGDDPYEGLPYVDYRSDKIYGSLIDNCPASKIHDSYVKNAEAFVGGEVCYRLNRGVTNGSQKWYQTLGSDLSPVLNNIRGTVYHGYDGDVLKYSNTTLTIPTTKHEQCAATCNARGYSQDCWEDNNSGKIYAEAACLHELNQAAVISYIPSAADPTYQINQGDISGWTQEVNEEYDGVNFGYAAVKVFEDYDGTNDNYGTDEWVSFLVKEANAKNARLKWAWTGGENSKKDSNGKYGGCTLTYKVNSGEETEITLPNTSFEVSPDVYTLNLDGLKKDDVVEFHIKGYGTHTSPNKVTWAVTLEYVSGHNPQHTSAKAATCTEKGNYEYWYCPDCETYFTNEACTASTTEITIAALGHDFTYTPYKTSTCTSKGDVEHWHCNRCEKDFNVGETMASEDHVISGSLTIPCKDADAIVVGLDEGRVYDDCHMFTPPTEEGETVVATVTFDEGAVTIKVADKSGEPTSYTLNETNPLETFFARTFTLTANQDPDNQENYYSTFFTSEGAYKIPEGVKAYIGEVEKTDDPDSDILNLTDLAGGVIHKKEGVVLKADKQNILLMPSCNKGDASSENKLTGTDEYIPTPEAGTYGLTYDYQTGVGFYLWTNPIPANKAFLVLEDGGSIKALRFIFDDDNDADGIHAARKDREGKAFNLQGVKVGKGYKGMVIDNGRKVIRR